MKKHAKRFYMAAAAALMLVFMLPSCSTQVRLQKKPHHDPTVDVQIQGGYDPDHRHDRHRDGKGRKSMPPGQAKKVTGSQSAAPYAPGQNKQK